MDHQFDYKYSNIGIALCLMYQFLFYNVSTLGVTVLTCLNVLKVSKLLGLAKLFICQ